MPRWTPFEPYFWSLVKKPDGAGCWEWQGGKDGNGYGRVWRNGARQGAHRAAYEILKGPITGGLYACHRCDNPICVRPDPQHVFLGTQKDNMQDWTQKGKNRLANDRTLWSNGKHWKANPTSRGKLSATRKAEFADGRRVAIRGEGGRIIGTKMRRST